MKDILNVKNKQKHLSNIQLDISKQKKHLSNTHSDNNTQTNMYLSI